MRSDDIVSEGIHLGIVDMIDDARGSQVENSGGAGYGGDNGVIIKQIDLEKTEAGFSSFHGLQVLCFFLILW